MIAPPQPTGWQQARPYIIRHFLVPGLAGSLAGCACVAGLLALDVGGLRALMLGGPDGWIALPLLAGRLQRFFHSCRGQTAACAGLSAQLTEGA